MGDPNAPLAPIWYTMICNSVNSNHLLRDGEEDFTQGDYPGQYIEEDIQVLKNGFAQIPDWIQPVLGLIMHEAYMQAAFWMKREAPSCISAAPLMSTEHSLFIYSERTQRDDLPCPCHFDEHQYHRHETK